MDPVFFILKGVASGELTPEQALPLIKQAVRATEQTTTSTTTTSTSNPTLTMPTTCHWHT